MTVYGTPVQIFNVNGEIRGSFWINPRN